MQAVILAGGLGTRLKPFTQAIPKPLLPIGEKAVLEIQIEHLVKHGFKEIYIATNYKSGYIESFIGDGSKYGAQVYISREEKPLGTAGPLTLLRDNLHKPFLMINGDILTLLNLHNFYEAALAMHTVLTVGVKEFLMPFQFGNIFSENGYVTGIEEKPDIKTNILAGVYVFTPGIFDYIPEGCYFGMDTLIKTLLQKEIPVAKYDIKEYWLDIGRIEDYETAQKVYEEQFKQED